MQTSRRPRPLTFRTCRGAQFHPICRQSINSVRYGQSLFREDSMKKAPRSRAILHTSLGVALGAIMFAIPAAAQKQGGAITVGLETDIPGFDPLKVGVFDTAAETAA